MFFELLIILSGCHVFIVMFLWIADVMFYTNYLSVLFRAVDNITLIVECHASSSVFCLAIALEIFRHCYLPLKLPFIDPF